MIVIYVEMTRQRLHDAGVNLCKRAKHRSLTVKWRVLGYNLRKSGYNAGISCDCCKENQQKRGKEKVESWTSAIN